MTNEFLQEIEALNQEIEKNGDSCHGFELYYERGYFRFLRDENEEAKEDYKKALSCGLDATEAPYYAFSNSNSKRREFLLPEKIMVFLLLLMIFAALVMQVVGFILKLKA